MNLRPIVDSVLLDGIGQFAQVLASLRAAQRRTEYPDTHTNECAAQIERVHVLAQAVGNLPEPVRQAAVEFLRVGFGLGSGVVAMVCRTARPFAGFFRCRAPGRGVLWVIALIAKGGAP